MLWGYEILRSGIRRLFACLPVAGALSAAAFAQDATIQAPLSASPSELTKTLRQQLDDAGFRGDMQAEFEKRLGRKLNPDLVDLGRSLFFDPILALGNDNSCAGCHSPADGFADSQSIAIGIGTKDCVVGPSREGPRNQRRTPTVINTAFYPRLMWNGRFAAPSEDPFKNYPAFAFPPPEGDGSAADRFFPERDPHQTHLLIAQAQIPSTELPEMAGFHLEERPNGESVLQTFRESRFGGQRFSIQALNFVAGKDTATCAQPDVLPHPLGGFFNEPVRGRVLLRLNASPEYIKLFKKALPDRMNESKNVILFEMVGEAIAEFEFSLIFADAPIDKFKRGEASILDNDDEMKAGGVLFFGKADCAGCHAVGGVSNDMFSDFQNHVLAIPQIAPTESGFGNPIGNVKFQGPASNEDFGLEDITLKEESRYMFRTSPLRNMILQPTFGHNGAWTVSQKSSDPGFPFEKGDPKILIPMINHHLNPLKSLQTYNPEKAGVDEDLQHNIGPYLPMLAKLSPDLDTSINLSQAEVEVLAKFVMIALSDENVTIANLCKLVPTSLPSGLSVQKFEECPPAAP